MAKRTKLLRGKVRIADLLAKSDVRSMLDKLETKANEIDEIIVIYQERNNGETISFQWANMIDSRVVYLLEVIKNQVLCGDKDD